MGEVKEQKPLTAGDVFKAFGKLGGMAIDTLTAPVLEERPPSSSEQQQQEPPPKRKRRDFLVSVAKRSKWMAKRHEGTRPIKFDRKIKSKHNKISKYLSIYIYI